MGLSTGETSCVLTAAAALLPVVQQFLPQLEFVVPLRCAVGALPAMQNLPFTAAAKWGHHRFASSLLHVSFVQAL